MVRPRPTRQTAYALLDSISQVKDKDERRKQLRELCIMMPACALVVQYTYHPNVEFDLPSPDLLKQMYTQAAHDDTSIFYRYVKKLPMFFTNSPVPRQRKESNFIGLLCDVAGRDADLLLAIIDRKLPWKTLNKPFCVKAMPELFPESMEVAED